MLNSTGKISLGGSVTGESVNIELGQAQTAKITLNDTNVRNLTLSNTAPLSKISMNDLRGRSAGATGDGFWPPSRIGGQNYSIVNYLSSISFANDASTTVSSGWTTAKSDLSTFSNNTKGYMFGGFIGGDTVVTRHTFATGTIADVFNMSTYRGWYLTQVFSSPSEGFYQGGMDCYSYYETQDILNFSTETLSTAFYYSANYWFSIGVFQDEYEKAQSSSAGYFHNDGDTRYGPARINKFLFATRTYANTAYWARPQSGSAYSSKWSGYNSENAAYWSGGEQNLSAYSAIDKMDFATDTLSLGVAALTGTRTYHACVNSSARGYSAGGSNNSFSIGIWYNSIVGHTFTTNAVNTLSATLIQPMWYLSGMGYQSGGML